MWFTPTILYSANIALEYMKSKISKCTSEIACELLKNIEKRINAGTNVNLINLFKSLKDPKCVPNKQTLDLATHLLKKLFQNTAKNDSAVICPELIIIENQKDFTMEEELNLIRKNAEDPPKTFESYGKLNEEFLLFRNAGKRTSNLELLYNAISSVKPTSTSNERTFSTSANFCTKIRSRLSDASLNALVFLKYYYVKAKNVKEPK